MSWIASQDCSSRITHCCVKTNWSGISERRPWVENQFQLLVVTFLNVRGSGRELPHFVPRARPQTVHVLPPTRILKLPFQSEITKGVNPCSLSGRKEGHLVTDAQCTNGHRGFLRADPEPSADCSASPPQSTLTPSPTS